MAANVSFADSTVNVGGSPYASVRHGFRGIPQDSLPVHFSLNEEVNIVAELVGDYEMAREVRSSIFATAGSINNESR
jgi:hypothetical protein